MKHPDNTTSDIPSILLRNLKSGNKKPVLILSTYGLGKSQQAAAFAKSQGMHYIDYRAAYKTFNDVRGYGIPNRESGKMEFLPDEDFDFHPTKVNCLHFEELLLANGAVQKPLMQITLDRKIGRTPLPEGTFIMASSNRLQDKTGVERMIAALADRFAIYHIRPDMDSFMNYMGQHGNSAEVMSFLNVNSDAPYDFDIKKWDGESNLPTFRSFERLDELASSYDSVGEMVADRLLPAHASACVGPKVGSNFAQFVKLTSQIGDVGAMVDNAADIKIPSQPDIKWIIACRLVSIAEKSNLGNVLLLAHRLSEPDQTDWKYNAKPSAMQTYVATSLVRRNPELLRSAELMEWHQKFAEELTTI